MFVKNKLMGSSDSPIDRRSFVRYFSIADPIAFETTNLL